MRSVFIIPRPAVNVAGAVLRSIFAIIFAVAGFVLGRELYLNVFSLHFSSEALQLTLLIATPAVGAVLGLLVAPLAHQLFEVELEVVESAIERQSPSEIAGGAVGLVSGLIIAFLIKSILFEFVSFTGKTGSIIAIVVYFIVAVFTAYLGVRVGSKIQIGAISASDGAPVQKIVDTSVIVDGRVVDIVETAFLEGPLVIPRFVLRELQAIADSTDSMKRMRGRRGLDVLSRLQELTSLTISDRDYADVPPGNVDAKLVRLARETGGYLLTNDYNLNRVAHVEGVRVLNINELASAVKPVVLPGEELHVHVIREGKEQSQGVGYLDDGTMIVVEGGRRLIGENTDVVVTSVLQTVAGRMIFARPRAQAAEGR